MISPDPPITPSLGPTGTPSDPVTDNPEPFPNPMEYRDTDDPAVVARYKEVNRYAYVLYRSILDNAPESAERTLAIRKLQETRMWANAAIALDGLRYPL